MNQDDRQLISDLFDRMRQVRDLDKDRDAEGFIHQSMRDNPDSPYLLVQSVLVQEQALQEADKRIRELEAQIAGGAAANSGRPRSSAGFGGGSVPATGAQAPWEAPAAVSSSQSGAWGSPPGGSMASAVPSAGAPRASANDAGQPPRGKREAPNQGRGGGGFMAQAMTTAAGVAGGMLLANSIGSLFGSSNSSNTETASTDSGAGSANETAAADAAQPAQDASHDAGQDASMQEASHDDGGWDDGWGGDDDWGGDFDI